MSILLVGGSSQYLSVGNEADYDLTTAISLAGWFRHTGLWQRTWESIIGKGDSAWRLSRYSGGTNRGLHWATSGTSSQYLNYDGTVDDDLWHFVVTTFVTGSPGRKYIFLDGAIVASDVDETGTINTNGNVVYLGENSGAGGRYFDGDLFDWRIYNRELALAEMIAMYTLRGGDNIKLGLLSRWLCNEGYPGETVASAIADVGALQNNATQHNSPVWSESVAGFRKRRAG